MDQGFANIQMSALPRVLFVLDRQRPCITGPVVPVYVTCMSYFHPSTVAPAIKSAERRLMIAIAYTDDV